MFHIFFHLYSVSTCQTGLCAEKIEIMYVEQGKLCVKNF